MTARARSKYADNSSRTASGSRLSDNGVKPTRSAKRSETISRSETGAALVATASVVTGEADVAGAGVSSVPHSLQNLPPVTGAPQLGHVAASGVPHSEQNFAPGRLTAPQLAQLSSAIRASRDAANLKALQWLAR